MQLSPPPELEEDAPVEAELLTEDDADDDAEAEEDAVDMPVDADVEPPPAPLLLPDVEPAGSLVTSLEQAPTATADHTPTVASTA